MSVDFTNSYQTVPLPNGKIINGTFDTITWFHAISKHIDFKNKTMLDIGCCEFSYGIQALNLGAAHITGLDSDQLRIDQSQSIIQECNYTDRTTLVKGFAEEYEPLNHDITLFSMVIHWMKDPEHHIKRILLKSNMAIFMYRVRGFAEDTGYLPTMEELDSLMGTSHMVYETISDTKEQNIRLAIYDLKK